MGSARTGKRRPTRDLRVTDPDAALGVPATAVRRWAGAVLDGEGVGQAALSITFLGGAKMRALHRRALGRDRATDVIAFRLLHVDQLAGDIYICPSVARRAARGAGVTEREETLRLVVHGVLHVLGQEHPDGAGRTRSAMWRRQECYVERLTGRTPR